MRCRFRKTRVWLVLLATMTGPTIPGVAAAVSPQYRDVLPPAAAEAAANLRRLVASACEHYATVGRWPRQTLNQVDNLNFPVFEISAHDPHGFTANFQVVDLAIDWMLAIRSRDDSSGCENAVLIIRGESPAGDEIISVETRGNLIDADSVSLKHLLGEQLARKTAMERSGSNEETITLTPQQQEKANQVGAVIVEILFRLLLCATAVSLGASTC